MRFLITVALFMTSSHGLGLSSTFDELGNTHRRGTGLLEDVWEGWTTFEDNIDEDGEVVPGPGNQRFDAEFLLWKQEGNILHLGLQTGYNIIDGEYLHSDGHVYYAGDLALSFDDATIGDSDSYEYAIDFGLLTKGYSGTVVGDPAGDGIDEAGLYRVDSWNNDMVSEYVAESSPYAMQVGSLIENALQSNVAGKATQNDDLTFWRKVSIDLSTIDGDIEEIHAHWTMSCGNDNINGSFNPGPSDAPLTGGVASTLVAMVGFLGLRRRIKK